MKARNIKDAKKFQDIPNVGPRVADDFMVLGFKEPIDLKGEDPLDLYKRLCKKTNSRQDPCVLDVFMAVVDFANGKKALPWWKYTEGRKKKYSQL